MSNTEQKKSKRRIVVPLAFTAIAGAGIFAVTSSALFTDSATVAGNTFTSGSVSISADPATKVFQVENMAPGDVVYKSITVKNDGSLQHRYSITDALSADGNTGLAAGATPLQLNVKAMSKAACDAQQADNLAGDAAWQAGDSVHAISAIVPADGKIAGDVATGQNAGDRVLAAGASEDLCFQVSLPIAADNTYQGTKASVDFTFSAEQTQNNA